MTIAPAYSFVLWAIPRFHREGAAKSERSAGDAQPDQLGTSAAAYAARDLIPAAHMETREAAACLHAHPCRNHLTSERSLQKDAGRC